MCCATATKTVAVPAYNRAHPTVHAVSPSGVPLLLRKPLPKASTSSIPLGGPPVPGGGSQGGNVGRGVAPGGGGLGGGPVYNGGGRGGSQGEIANRGGNFSVLPPIRDNGRFKESTGSFSLSELDDITLKNEALRAMKEVPDRTLQSLLSNLRAQDRDRDGILSSDQVKGTLRKFQFNLSDGAQKNLCRKFGQPGDHVAMVRYEDMFGYLAKSRMEAVRAPPSMPATGQSGSSQTSQQQYPRKINLRNKVLFSDRDEAKLIIDLERQLADKPVNMADLRGIMINFDRDRNDYITGPQVETAFRKCGINLTPDVMSRLLLATDRTGAGMYKIDTLIDYLIRIRPEAHSVMLGNNHNPRPPKVGKLPMYINQPTLTAPWEYQQSSQQGNSEFLPDEGFSEDHLQQPITPVSPVPQPTLEEPEEEEEPFDVHKWSRDYHKLAEAIYSADSDRSGYMPAEEVRRVSNTYNAVYRLDISDVSINTALITATDPNYGEVHLEYYIAVLQDLHFREIEDY
ncbi:uncharacterized protein LOC135203557 isoform X2 [Macrobrachium nipponense]|uniref:uncharacterized protein LOC135203557 isoform X2 n=1 Tax=Macrobrachium nipponense TaxID=159736 RepID=UPI0030C7BEE0